MVVVVVEEEVGKLMRGGDVAGKARASCSSSDFASWLTDCLTELLAIDDRAERVAFRLLRAARWDGMGWRVGVWRGVRNWLR